MKETYWFAYRDETPGQLPGVPILIGPFNEYQLAKDERISKQRGNMSCTPIVSFVGESTDDARSRALKRIRRETYSLF